MSAKRSLNKLEFKAHMNIHNTADATEGTGEERLPRYTRDRLGRKHALENNDEA